MRLITTEKPRRRAQKHELEDFLREFVADNVLCAEVVDLKSNYANAHSAYGSMRRVANIYKLPIRVETHAEKLYLINTTIEGGTR